MSAHSRCLKRSTAWALVALMCASSPGHAPLHHEPASPYAYRFVPPSMPMGSGLKNCPRLGIEVSGMEVMPA
jgi:hypothetical protein